MDNTQLHNLYREFFSTSSLSPEMAGRCSSPLLLSVKPSWALSNQRLFMVGQETLGWAFDQGEYYDWPYPPIGSYSEFSQCTSGVEALIYAYEAFSFAEHQPKNHRSPFWRAFRYLMSSAGADALWSNLFRFDVDEGSVMSNCSEAELEQVFRAQQGLLKREIQLLRPTTIVFFTGPRYDQALINEYPDVVFTQVSHHPQRQFAQLSAQGLPGSSYRTYHPAFLARTKRLGWLDELARLITLPK